MPQILQKILAWKQSVNETEASLQNLRSQLRKQLRHRSLILSLISGVISGFASMLFDFFALKFLAEQFVVGFSIGTLIPLVFVAWRIEFLNNPASRRLSYSAYLLISNGMLMLIALIVNLAVGFFAFRDIVLTWSGQWPSIIMSLILAPVFTIAETVRQFTGKSVILNFFLGRYHHPKKEDLIFLFIDLKSSTVLAEKLDPNVFFQLLNDFHATIEDFVRFHEGQIYKYLGDGQIIVWPKTQADRALKTICGLESVLNPNLKFTAGLHCGPVLVGEIGTERKEIGYWGDTINTAQRIQDACKMYQTHILMSEDFFYLLSDKYINQLNLEKLENVLLRGRKNPVNLFKPRGLTIGEPYER
jgi:adenylate cyclase